MAQNAVSGVGADDDAAGGRVRAIRDVPGNMRRAYGADFHIAGRPDDLGFVRWLESRVLTNSAGPPVAMPTCPEKAYTENYDVLRIWRPASRTEHHLISDGLWKAKAGQSSARDAYGNRFPILVRSSIIYPSCL